MKSKVISILTGALLAASTVTAWGGLSSGTNVQVLSTEANGSLQTVRSSADTTQYIYCRALNASILCSARNTALTARDCIAFPTDPNYALMRQAILGINSASHVIFKWNAISTCTDVQVYNGSPYMKP